MSVFLLCNNLLQAQENLKNDGLYAIFSSERESLSYRLAIEDAADSVLRFISYFGGTIEKDEQDRYVFIQPRRIAIDSQIKDYAVTAGADSWSIAKVEHVLPVLKAQRQLEGALAFWRQRGQFRSDRLLFIYPGSYLAANTSYFHFASLVTGDLGKLQENEQLELSQLVAQGAEAKQWLERLLAGELQPLSTELLWQNYWDEKDAKLSKELSTLLRDSFGFYLEETALSETATTKAVDGDSVEFSYRVSTLDLPLDLQPWQSGVAILGRDRIEPLTAHFLRRIPVGSSWKILVPPYLQTNANTEALWLRYEISVTAVF